MDENCRSLNLSKTLGCIYSFSLSIWLLVSLLLNDKHYLFIQGTIVDDGGDKLIYRISRLL